MGLHTKRHHLVAGSPDAKSLIRSTTGTKTGRKLHTLESNHPRELSTNSIFRAGTEQHHHSLGNGLSTKLLTAKPHVTKKKKVLKEEIPSEGHGFLWFCCNCNFGLGCDVWLIHCAECQHKRCENCLVEHHWYLHRDDHIDPAEETEEANSISSPTTSERIDLETWSDIENLASETSPNSATSYEVENPNQLLTDTRTMEEQPLVHLPSGDLNGGEDFMRDIPLAYEDTGDTLTEDEVYRYESVFSDHVDDHDGIEIPQTAEEDAVYREHALEVFESRLITAFSSRLDLATILLPRIFVLADIAEFDVNYKTSPAKRGASKSRTSAGKNEKSSKPSTSSAKSKVYSKNHRQKRPRKDDDEEGSSRKPGYEPMKETLEGSAYNYACHFFKFDPVKYGPKNPGNYKFRRCVSIKVPILRRIKDHFTSIHVTGQCHRCLLHIPEAHRTAHANANDCDERLNQQDLDEGINLEQYHEIQRITACKTTDGVTKWYEIWGVLFPGVERPSTPFTELPVVHGLQSLDIEQIRGRFLRFIQHDEQIQTLRPSDSFTTRLLWAFDQAVEESRGNNITTNIGSPVPSSPSYPTPNSLTFPRAISSVFDIPGDQISSMDGIVMDNYQPHDLPFRNFQQPENGYPTPGYYNTAYQFNYTAQVPNVANMNSMASLVGDARPSTSQTLWPPEFTHQSSVMGDETSSFLDHQTSFWGDQTEEWLSIDGDMIVDDPGASIGSHEDLNGFFEEEDV